VEQICIYVLHGHLWWFVDQPQKSVRFSKAFPLVNSVSHLIGSKNKHFDNTAIAIGVWSGQRPSFNFFLVLGFKLNASHLLGRCSTTWSLFFVGFFRDRFSQTVCPGWLQISILLMSASWVARIMSVSHQCPPMFWCLFPMQVSEENPVGV
jgi:hypothetical protein